VAQSSRHDAWQAGDNYDAYMGRWSRLVAPLFLDWLGLSDDLDWLEVGCGTGALSAAILSQCRPKSLVAIDPSEGFVARARANVPDERARFQAGDAQALEIETASRDVIVSGLVLNFVPDKEKALAEMQRVARPGGTVAFYVWDYPGRGMEVMRAFWDAATALDPGARHLAEDKRFPFCTPEGLAELISRGGLGAVECTPIVVDTVFSLQGFRGLLASLHLGNGAGPGLLHEPRSRGAPAAAGEPPRQPSTP
jgi:ubiquinone/menaquinone biosynthesis C-methylase UbiE